MGTRLQLQTLLKRITGNVYFQPPTGTDIHYPCIIYGRTSGNPPQYADNQPYINQKRYQVTVIDKDPDSIIPDEVAKLPMCTFDRSYPADNLNHSVYNLYF